MSYTALSTTRPKARKNYRCVWCPEKILKGEGHVHEAGVYDGDFQDSRYHTECYEASGEFFRDNPHDDCFEPHEFKRGTSEPAEFEGRRPIILCAGPARRG